MEDLQSRPYRINACVKFPGQIGFLSGFATEDGRSIRIATHVEKEAAIGISDLLRSQLRDSTFRFRACVVLAEERDVFLHEAVFREVVMYPFVPKHREPDGGEVVHVEGFLLETLPIGLVGHPMGPGTFDSSPPGGV